MHHFLFRITILLAAGMAIITPASANLLLTNAGDNGAPQSCVAEDGCAGAPAVTPAQLASQLSGGYMVQHSDFFTGYAAQSITAPGSGQPSNGVFPVRPPWHVAGVDYAVGIPPSALPLKIPGVNTLPPHCYAYTVAPGTAANHVNCQQDAGSTFTGFISGNQMTVSAVASGTLVAGAVVTDTSTGATATISSLLPSGTGTIGTYTLSNSTMSNGPNFTTGGITLDGWDFSQHGGIFLDITFAVNGPVVIKNSKFVYGPTFASTGAFATTGNMITLSSAGSLLFANNYLDMNGPQGALDGSGLSNIMTVGHFPMTFLYNAMQRARIRYISTINYAVQGDFIMKYNYFEGLIYSPNDVSHGEITLLTWSGVMNNYIAQYNTFLQPNTTYKDSNVMGLTSSLAPSVSTTPGAILTNLLIDHEVHVNNNAFVNGAYVTVGNSGSVGAHLMYASFINVTLTNNWLGKTGANYCWYDPGQANVFTNFVSGGNINLNTGHPANGLALSGLVATGSLSHGVLTVVSLSFGGIGVGSEISIGGLKVHVVSQGSGTGGLGTYNVDNSTATVALSSFGVYADQCDYAP